MSLKEFLKNIPLGYGCDSIYYCDDYKDWLFIRDEESDINALSLFK